MRRAVQGTYGTGSMKASARSSIYGAQLGLQTSKVNPPGSTSVTSCAWSVPGDTILEKKLNPMGYEEASLDSPNGSMMMIAGVGAAVLAVGVYMYRDYFKMVMDA